MRLSFIAIAMTGLLLPSFGQEADANVYTLYRNSVLDITMRIHIATFDSDEGKDYNAENCFQAADLFQNQGGVQTRFWCEPGEYKE